jgi:hypothetical protein
MRGGLSFLTLTVLNYSTLEEELRGVSGLRLMIAVGVSLKLKNF